MEDQGAIVVDEHNRSTCDSIYAIGDVTNRIQLTPIAIREGQGVRRHRVYGGKDARVDYENVPSAVFSHPADCGGRPDREPGAAEAGLGRGLYQ